MRRKNRGFTLVEVVIAVSIAVIVSIAAAAVIISTRTSTNEAKYKNNAVSFANNVLEVFKASDSFDDMKKGLQYTFVDGDYNLTFECASGDTETTAYLYLKDSGVLTDVGRSGSDIATSYMASRTGNNCRFVVEINVSSFNSGAKHTFTDNTELNVVVYKVVSTYTGTPKAGNAIYEIKNYKKGVAD